MEERGDAWGRVQAVLPGVLQLLEGGQRSTAAPCRSLKTPAPSPLVRPCCLMQVTEVVRSHTARFARGWRFFIVYGLFVGTQGLVVFLG